ncbi:hypothetical protein [Streptomyces sp. NPDC002205]|uniref:hypothetical protein n=1 Tax=Streptomyces sp. NPDC002205 TaxID=3154411 RepID=UPI00332257B4
MGTGSQDVPQLPYGALVVVLLTRCGCWGAYGTATVRQMAQVITAEDADGRSYVRRAMKRLAELGLAETNVVQRVAQRWC